MNGRLNPDNFRIIRADNGEEIAKAKQANIHFACPEQEQTDYRPTHHTIMYELKMNDIEYERLLSTLQFTRQERRKLFYAVTHGQAVVIMANFVAEGKEPWQAPVYIDCPRILRRVLAIAHNYRFDFEIKPKRECLNLRRFH